MLGARAISGARPVLTGLKSERRSGAFRLMVFPMHSSTSIADEAIAAKLRAGRPVQLDAEEARQVVEALRTALAVVLECPPQQLADDAKLFDDLALDSIDVFDVLDQLAERFEAQVALEDLPAELIRGKEGLTFSDFAEGILTYFRTPPKARPAGPAVAGSGGGSA
jgi:acyl carrier protein